jgi:hypothetical protein
MGGWRRYLELQAQAKTGLGSGLFIWALLAATFAILTAAFILLVAFIWLAERYDPLRAAAALAGFSCWLRLLRSFAVCGRGAGRWNAPSSPWRRAETRSGSTRKSSAAQFRSAVPSAGASSFRCWPSAFSPPAPGWNGLAATDRSSRASRTAAASLLERRKDFGLLLQVVVRVLSNGREPTSLPAVEPVTLRRNT